MGREGGTGRNGTGRDGQESRECFDELKAVYSETMSRVLATNFRGYIRSLLRLQVPQSTHTRARAHTRTHARTHARAHTHARARAHTHTRARVHAHTQPCNARCGAARRGEV